MKRTKGIRVRSALVMTMALFLPIAVAQADTRSDAWITSQAQSVLRSAEGMRMATVQVETSHGRVTLFGEVNDRHDKDSAAADVQRVPGVVQVRNLLQIIAPGATDRTRRSDDVIKADVRRTLSADRSLDDSRITVVSVSNGVVLLSGRATSAADIVRAFASVGRRPGVLRVFSEIEAQGPFAVSSRTDEPSAPIRAAAIAQVAPALSDDEIIRRSVMNALTDLDARGNADVRVTVQDGVVRLGGTVPTWDGNDARLHAARSVAGVRSINNTVRVVASAAEPR